MFDSLFRNKVGMPTSSDILNRHIDVYKKIIEDKNTMENRAIDELQKVSQWQTLLMRREQLDYETRKGNISYDEWCSLNQEIEDMKLETMADFIDSQGSNTIYGVIRSGLQNLKRRNINLPNMNQMEFDLWKQIVDSAELAQLSIVQVMNSDKYIDSMNSDKIVRDYQVRRHFRK